MKKPWMKPELVVLLRQRAEEAVLQACKTEDAGSGPSQTWKNCSAPVGEECFNCEGVWFT